MHLPGNMSSVTTPGRIGYNVPSFSIFVESIPSGNIPAQYTTSFPEIIFKANPTGVYLPCESRTFSGDLSFCLKSPVNKVRV